MAVVLQKFLLEEKFMPLEDRLGATTQCAIVRVHIKQCH